MAKKNNFRELQETLGILQAFNDDNFQEFGLYKNSDSKEVHLVRVEKNSNGVYSYLDDGPICERISFEGEILLLPGDFETGSRAFIEAYEYHGRDLCSHCGAKFLVSVD